MKTEEIIVGTTVTYWKVIKENGDKFDPIASEILSEPWQLGHGEWVCKIYGISGGVAISHLEKRELKTSHDIPQTNFARTIPVNAFDAKQFLANIEVQISLLDQLNKKDEVKHWRSIYKQAHRLFGIPYNSTDPETQKKIEEACNGKV